MNDWVIQINHSPNCRNFSEDICDCGGLWTTVRERMGLDTNETGTMKPRTLEYCIWFLNEQRNFISSLIFDGPLNFTYRIANLQTGEVIPIEGLGF